MKFMFAGINVDASKYSELAEQKLSKLDQYFDEDLQCDVTFETFKNESIVEVTVYLPGNIIRSEESSSSFRDSIDLALDTLEGQIRKYKTKLQNRYQATDTIKFGEFFEDVEIEEDEDKGPKIVKTKHFGLKPMNPEEASLQMELLGHNFFVFLDGEDEQVKVVYKRKDGNYGLIEPTF